MLVERTSFQKSRTRFFLNIVLQQGLGLSAFESGLALLPMTVTIMVLMVAATGGFIGRLGAKNALVAGRTLLAVALLLFAQMPADASFVRHVLGLVSSAQFGRLEGAWVDRRAGEIEAAVLPRSRPWSR